MFQANKTIQIYKTIGVSDSKTTPKLNTDSAKSLKKSKNKGAAATILNYENNSKKVVQPKDKNYNYNYRKETAVNDQNNCDQKIPTVSDIILEVEPTNTKICLVSSNTRNKLLVTTQRTFPHTEICHYLIPNGGILQLLSGIENRLNDYTLNDFCVIFIGESDFEHTNDYPKLIEYIRQELQKVQHTNIIVCLPTFKCRVSGITLFTKRIEAFNNLIYLDNITHAYAYLLDSNKNLQYNYTMFSKHSGRLNNYGLLTIFTELKELVVSILKETRSYTIYEILPNSKTDNGVAQENCFR